MMKNKLNLDKKELCKGIFNAMFLSGKAGILTIICLFTFSTALLFNMPFLTFISLLTIAYFIGESMRLKQKYKED